MADRRKYLKRADQTVIAVPLAFETSGFAYEKWGSTQHCKPGVWNVQNHDEVYTVRTVFVVSSGSTPFHAARQAVDNIGRDRIIGAVMNKADSGDGNRALEYVKLARSGHRQR